MLGEAARFMKKPIGKVQQAMPKLLAMVEGGGITSLKLAAR